MRFNPPPNWPAPPEGWEPPPNWAPDPAWPPMPEGWQLWVPDGAPTHPTDGPGGPASPAGPGGPGGTGPADQGPAWVGEAVPYAAPQASGDDDVRRLRRSAAIKFWIGVALFPLVYALNIITVVFDLGGGVLWYGGLIVGVILMINALQDRRASRAAGGPPMSTGGKVGVSAGLLVCALVVGDFVWGMVDPWEPEDATGTCWRDEGLETINVPCGEEHDYVVNVVTDDPALCPLAAEYYLEDVDGTVYCLEDA